jgi:RNA polymerase sigma factor (sigma-70 family)
MREDFELMSRVATGDDVALSRVYEIHSGVLFALAKRYVNNYAEDILQEFFISLPNRANKYGGTGSLQGWLRKVLINDCLRYIKKNKLIAYGADLPEVAYNQNITGSVGASSLLVILNTLPLGYKTVFSLHAIDGYSHKEIAKMLNIEECTSRTQFFKARKRLASILKAEKIEYDGYSC